MDSTEVTARNKVTREATKNARVFIEVIVLSSFGLLVYTVDLDNQSTKSTIATAACQDLQFAMSMSCPFSRIVFNAGNSLRTFSLSDGSSPCVAASREASCAMAPRIPESSFTTRFSS